MMDYKLIAEKDEHALIQRGSRMQQYAAVCCGKRSGQG